MPTSRKMSRHVARVAITAGSETNPARRKRASCEDSSRLHGIMVFEPLRDAFGDFCHRSLCGEVGPRGDVGPEAVLSPQADHSLQKQACFVAVSRGLIN